MLPSAEDQRVEDSSAHEYSVTMVEHELTGSYASVNVSFPMNILDSDEESIEQSIRALKQQTRRRFAMNRTSKSQSEGTKLSIKTIRCPLVTAHHWTLRKTQRMKVWR